MKYVELIDGIYRHRVPVDGKRHLTHDADCWCYPRMATDADLTYLIVHLVRNWTTYGRVA